MNRLTLSAGTAVFKRIDHRVRTQVRGVKVSAVVHAAEDDGQERTGAIGFILSTRHPLSGLCLLDLDGVTSGQSARPFII